jgi:branched-chain amino acid transport system permease protein
VALACLGAVLVLARTRTGLAMVGLGASPASLAAGGWSPTSLTVAAFALSAALGGLGGVLVAGGYGSLSGNDIVPFNSVVLWALLFNLGVRRPAAAWLAAAALPAATYFDLGGSLLPIVAGAGLILSGARSPDGALAQLDALAGRGAEAPTGAERGR